MNETAERFKANLENSMGRRKYELLNRVILDLADAGGNVRAVGGAVRDFFMQREKIEDLDMEISGLNLDSVEKILSRSGDVIKIGKSFGVLRLKGLDVDFSLPRKDSKSGVGHTGFEISIDPFMSAADAAKRRDLTINAIGIDLITGEVVDPAGGVRDIRKKILRVVDPVTFVDDPLRVYRIAQFTARFVFAVERETVKLASTMTPENLPPERIFAEFRKLMLQGVKPSSGFEFLKDCGWIRYHPELERLSDTPQEPEWHPEGDVWRHTMLSLDKATEYRNGNTLHDLKLMFAVLCHDFGKAYTTKRRKGRIVSPGHDQAGVEPARRFMSRLTNHRELIEAVTVLTAEHMKPGSLSYKNEISDRAVRRLSLRLAPYADIKLLVEVARADHMSRPGYQSFPGGDLLLRKAEALKLSSSAEKPVLKGRHLIAAGMKPGIEFGKILSRAFDIQVRDGITDPEQLLKRVLPDRLRTGKTKENHDTEQSSASKENSSENHEKGKK